MSRSVESLTAAATSVLCAQDALRRAVDDYRHAGNALVQPRDTVRSNVAALEAMEALNQSLTEARTALSVLHTRTCELIRSERDR